MEKSFRDLINKLIAMLPENVSVDSSLINNEVHFISDPITVLQDGVFENALKATKMHCTLRLEYKTAQNTDFELRKFDPYHVICQKGSWYVLGYSDSIVGYASNQELRNNKRKVFDSKRLQA